MSLQGTEVVLRLTGAGAKHLILFIAAAIKNRNGKLKSRGCARLEAMLKSGKPLEIFSVKEADLEKFVGGAKNYGIVYSVVKNPKDCPDNLCDILVLQEDAPKITRLSERVGFTTLDHKTVEVERERAMPEQETAPAAPNRDTAEDLVNDLLGTDEGKTAPEEKEPMPPNPNMAKTEHPRPSAPFSESNLRTAEGTDGRSSVRGALNQIKAAQMAARQKKTEAPAQEKKPDKPHSKTTNHKHPPKGNKPKKKGRKSR